MGTSVSSKGPASGIPLDPPWLQPDPDTGNENTQLAQPMRFGSARRNLSEYIQSGSHDSLGRALGHYSKEGMGGAKKLAHRMQATAKSAAGIYRFFHDIQDTTNESLHSWVESLRNNQLQTDNIVDQFVDRVLPLKGTLDEDSCRISMDKALMELTIETPEINLFQLSEDDIWHLVTLFVRNEAYQRLNTDLGKKFEEAQVSPLVIVDRQRKMSSYLRSEIDAQIISARKTAPPEDTQNLESIISIAIENTFTVYEEYLP
ncbi:MAG: Qat anti-phage system associated protein QatB [Acinetobacter sp.]